MSCWIVSDTLISALVTAAARYDKYRQLPGADWPALHAAHPEAFPRMGGKLAGFIPNDSNVAKEYPSEIGRALALANVQSMDACYNGRHTSADDYADALAFRCEPVTLDPVTLIKQVHCYAYQSCEAPGWDSSWAKKFCAELESILIRNLPGYEAAPWGVS